MQGIESSNEDFMLFKALCCKTCDRLVHTDCAIALHQLRLIQYLGKFSVFEIPMIYVAC